VLGQNVLTRNSRGKGSVSLVKSGDRKQRTDLHGTLETPPGEVWRGEMEGKLVPIDKARKMQGRWEKKGQGGTGGQQRLKSKDNDGTNKREGNILKDEKAEN